MADAVLFKVHLPTHARRCMVPKLVSAYTSP